MSFYKKKMSVHNDEKMHSFPIDGQRWQVTQSGTKSVEMTVEFNGEIWIDEHRTRDCECTKSFSIDPSHNLEDFLCNQILNDHGHWENIEGKGEKT